VSTTSSNSDSGSDLSPCLKAKVLLTKTYAKNPVSLKNRRYIREMLDAETGFLTRLA